MSVEIPDTSGTGGSGDPKPRSRAILTAIGLMVVASIGVGLLSRQEKEDPVTTLASEETTTSLPALNDPLDWRAAQLGNMWTQGVVEFDGSLYLFATAEPSFFSEEGSGLDAWLLVDGVTWRPLGTVIQAPNRIHTVSATPRGLVAAGSNGDSLHLWTSPDAREWRQSDLPGPPTESGYLSTGIHAIGATDDVTVVFGSTQTDISSLIRDVLPPELLAEYGTSPYGYGWGELPLLTVYGPLGLTVFTATAEDLGLTEVDVRELSGGGPDPTTLWTSNDGETWSMTELDLSYVNNVFDTGGELIAAGFGRSGAEIWTSPDGFEWTRESSTKSEFLARWRDGFVAGIEGPATGVSYSEDLSDWVSLGLAAYLGDDLSWQVNSLAASEGGVAVALWGYDEGGSFTGDPEPVAIDKGVYTLTVDSSNGSTTLTSGNDILMRLHSFSDQIQDDLEIDFPSETVTFLRPDTGEPLVTFTFDELDQAQADSYGNQSLASDQDQFIAYTSDGETWSIQSVADAFGEDIRIVQVHVTNEQVVVVGARATEAFLRVPTVPDLLTWTAVIP